ncbi:hypothetical protein LZ023_04280 [Pseudomonas silvicola]|nr:hypothetical protein LZ023_04280 [Pseudomonas silvicola]
MNTLVASRIVLSIFTAVLLTSCDQQDAPKKPTLGIEKTSIGSWAEGVWVHTPTEKALPKVSLQGNVATLDQCSFTVSNLLSPDGTQVFLAPDSQSTCPSEPHPSNITLTRKEPCSAVIERFESSEDLRKGPPINAGLYQKVSCVP